MTTSQLSKSAHQYELLAASRRRQLLSLLCEYDSLDLEMLTVELAAREAETVDEPVSEAARQRVYIELVHDHLPRLADHDLLEYDLQAGTIAPAEGFEAFEPTVERLCGDVSNVFRFAPSE